MGQYTTRTYCVHYTDNSEPGKYETVSCGTNKAQAQLFVILLNKLSGFRAEMEMREVVTPDWSGLSPF